MKKIIFSIITLFIVCSVVAQDRQVHIDYSIKLSNENNTKPSELYKAFEKQKFRLITSDSESLFFCLKKLNNSVTRTEEIARIYSGSNEKYYTDTKYVLIEKEISGNKYLIEKKKNSIKWIVTKEKKLIGEYICYKAIGEIIKLNFKGKKIKTEVIAWYCPQINYSVGPIGYNGLVGAILELQIAKMKYYATKVTILKENFLKIEKPLKGKTMTEKEFEVFSEKIYQDRDKY